MYHKELKKERNPVVWGWLLLVLIQYIENNTIY